MRLSPGRLFLLLSLLLIGGGILSWPRWIQDTEYAPGYSHRAFDALALGSEAAQVLAALGSPLDQRVTQPTESWLYADASHPGYAPDGSLDGTFTEITFDASGRVRSAFGQTTTEQSLSRTVMVMDGGPLKLGASWVGPASGEAAPALEIEGWTRAEVEQRYGAPRDRRVDRASEVWTYSRSPSGSHYHRVWVGLDAEGRVVETYRGDYWD